MRRRAESGAGANLQVTEIPPSDEPITVSIGTN